MENRPSSRTFHPDGQHRPRPSGKRQRKRIPVKTSPTGTARPVERRTGFADIRRRRQRTLFALYAVLGIESACALLTSPALAIKKVQAHGLDTLPPTEYAQTWEQLRVARDTNWFLTPLGRLRRDANALPWVRSATVERTFSGTLVAHITPRQPFLLLKVGPAWYEVDAEGTVIRFARSGMQRQLPSVVFQQDRALSPGQSLDDPSIPAAIQILQQLQPEQRVPLAKIVIDQSDNICLNMRDGMQLHLGQAEDVAAKVTLVKSIYTRDPGVGQTLAAINLSCPSAPACTPRVVQATPLFMGPPTPPSNVTP